ncbi:MAG TPA: hypothetical protein DCM08_08660 [Microscillaceae bacterium]|nr:hypothetical protein [Microscillaceae bacterium]
MIDENKIVLDKTIDIENEVTPFGKRWGGQTVTLTEADIENLKNGKLIGVDIQNEYIIYLQFKNK